MAHNDRIRAHRAESIERIDKRFAFRNTRARSCNGDDVRPEAFGGDFEASSSSGRGLEKQIDDRTATQNVETFKGLPRRRLEFLTARQNRFDVLAREGLDIQQPSPHGWDLCLPENRPLIISLVSRLRKPARRFSQLAKPSPGHRFPETSLR